jgi:hypothetical protein
MAEATVAASMDGLGSVAEDAALKDAVVSEAAAAASTVEEVSMGAVGSAAAPVDFMVEVAVVPTVAQVAASTVAGATAADTGKTSRS